MFFWLPTLDLSPRPGHQRKCPVFPVMVPSVCVSDMQKMNVPYFLLFISRFIETVAHTYKYSLTLRQKQMPNDILLLKPNVICIKWGKWTKVFSCDSR